MNNEIKRRIFAMTLAGSLVLVPKKVYASDIRCEHAFNNSNGGYDNYSSSVEEEVKSITSIDYDNKDDAQKWIDDTTDVLENNYDIVSEKIIETNVVKEEEEYVEERFDTLEEAEAKKEDFESEENTNCDLKIEEEKVSVEKETVVEFEETFDNKEDADKYKEGLSDKDNLEVKEEVTTSEDLGENEKVAEITENSEELLQSEIDKVLDGIDKEKYQTSVEKDYSEKEVLKEIKEKDINESFDTFEEAEEYIDSKNQVDSGNVSYEFGEIEKVTETKIENTDFEEVVDSEEKIKDIIEQIENEGFEITDYTITDESETITKEVETGTINVNNFVKYESNSYFEAQGNFIIIKQGSKTAVLWTPDEIGKDEQSKILDIILENNYDPSISNVSFNYISGVGSHDLSYLGNNWGIYDISYENGIIELACDKDRISHLNVGSYEPEKEVVEEVIPKFIVSGTKTREVVCGKFNVSGKMKESIYEKVPEYSAVIYRRPIYRNSSYRVYGQYVVKESEIETKYVLYGDIIRLIETKQYKGVIDYKRMKKDNQYDNLNSGELPKTADESNIDLVMSSFALSSLGLIGLAGYGLEHSDVKKKILK